GRAEEVGNVEREVEAGRDPRHHRGPEDRGRIHAGRIEPLPDRAGCGLIGLAGVPGEPADEGGERKRGSERDHVWSSLSETGLWLMSIRTGPASLGIGSARGQVAALNADLALRTTLTMSDWLPPRM